MDDELVVGGRNHHWYNQLTAEEILGPLPEPPSFREDIPAVRDRVRKLIGRVSVAKALTAKHPAIARLNKDPDEAPCNNNLAGDFDCLAMEMPTLPKRSCSARVVS